MDHASLPRAKSFTTLKSLRLAKKDPDGALFTSGYFNDVRTLMEMKLAFVQ